LIIISIQTARSRVAAWKLSDDNDDDDADDDDLKEIL
jgi:hypothetical protein